MDTYQYLRGLIVGFLLATLPLGVPLMADTQNIEKVPLFLGETIDPPVLVMLDSSGSMKRPLVTGSFNSSTTYTGMFDSNSTYEYDESILVNESAYEVDVDTNQTGAFVEATCTTSAANDTCWSGNFLNWLTTRRIDATRAVLSGGKVESTSPFDYDDDGDDATGPQFKILGNNEPADEKGQIDKSAGNSAAFSPIANSSDIAVRSPAGSINNGDQMAEYNPYGQIQFTGGGSGGTLIHDENGTVIGEFARAEIPRTEVDSVGNLTEDSWVKINLTKDYMDPVVVAKSLSFNGGDPSFVRIRNVKAVDDSFELTIQEWDYLDGAHTDETVAWMVMEAGEHELPGSSAVDIEAGHTETDKVATGGPSDTEDVSLGAFNEDDPPVVLSSVTTVNSQDAVNSRVSNVQHDEFELSLVKEEALASNPQMDETIDWIAIETGQVDPGDFNDSDHGIRVDVGKSMGVTDDETDINFNASFSGSPIALTDIQTINGSDPSGLRETDIDSGRVRVFVEEEESLTSETSHTGEAVGFAAFSNSASQSLNVALAVDDEPTGLLHDIVDDVRLGVSFYRYDPDSNDIYNDEKAHGGTLQFQIPKNPFVDKPSADQQSDKSHKKGYRKLDGYVGTDIEDIVDAVNNYPLVWGTTPLAENLWEAIQYFEQDAPFYNDKPDNNSRDTFIKGDKTNAQGDKTNPERDPFFYPEFDQALSCARPSALLFTDGRPFRDAFIPSSVVDFDGDGDGDDERGTSPNGQGRDNLDDVAHWGFCDPSASGTCDPGEANGGNRDLRASLNGTQSLSVNTIGFGGGGSVNQILQDTADNAGGDAFAAADGDALADAFEKAFEGIISRASFSAVAANTGRISSGARVFQAIFDSTNWSGDVEALNFDESTLSVESTAAWKAADQMPDRTDRDILTFDASEDSKHDFKWNNLTSDQQTELGSKAVLDFLRGDRSNEGTATGDFRQRASTLGDIINSEPVFVPGDGGSPPDMIYVGANDGMLHGFNADTGEEEMAYVPDAVYGKLADLTNQNYNHEYFVDGSPTFARQYFDEKDERVIVGGLNGGGQAIYALDVTNPTSMDASDDVLWEFNDVADSDGDGVTDGDPDLGLTYSEPTVAKLENDNWVAIFGNGYNNTASDGSASSNGTAVLFVVDLKTGELEEKIDTGEGGSDDPNGLATPAVADTDQDGIADVAYAGDLDGNMWKFDLSPGSFSASKLFTAESPSGDKQPITSQPQVGLHPAGFDGPVVYFGTGKYLTSKDNSQSGQDTQSFYAVWDQGTVFSRSDLLEQEITEEEKISKTDSNNPAQTIDNRLRTTSDNQIDWFDDSSNPSTGEGGWFIDLVDPDTNKNEGERIVNDARLRGDRVIFSTLIPSDSPCDFGGQSWLMELSTDNGGRLEEPPFDIDNDQAFTGNDLTDSGEPPSGIQRLTGGIISAPTFLDRSDVEVKISATTSGNTQTVTNNPTGGDRGRQSWEELR